MGENYKSRREDKELINQFEDLLKNKTSAFFALESYEYIIDYFIEHSVSQKKNLSCS